MWKLTTATIPSSFWVSSSTACKANKDEIFYVVLSVGILSLPTVLVPTHTVYTQFTWELSGRVWAS